MVDAPDPSFAGRSYPPGPVHVVSAAKIREFRAATGLEEPTPDSSQLSAKDEAALTAPPTFLVSLAQETEAQYISDPAAGIDFTRVVHGEEGFTLHRPVRAGDRLIPTLTVERVRAAGGHTMVSTRVDITDEDGAAVAAVRSMLVVRGQ